MMIYVLLVGLAIGLFFIAAALLNWESIHGNMEFGVVAALFGEGAGRLTCLLFGVAAIGIGVAGYFIR